MVANSFYRNGDAMMAVPVTSGASFSARAPAIVFRGPYETLYDVAKDGQRFLMIRSAAAENPPQLNVVLNWSTELAERTGQNK